jgi:hypothetical protein
MSTHREASDVPSVPSHSARIPRAGSADAMTSASGPVVLDGRLPNLVIAGVSRAGTTSLFTYLGQHPDIGTSDYKELRYFTPVRYGEPVGPLSDYAHHFRSCTERFAMEATPGYFYGGRGVAQALRDTCPNVRVVVSLRSPVERCWSWYGFVKSRLRIDKDMTFEAYVDTCMRLHDEGTDDTVENQPFWGVGGGVYADWMDAWTDELGDRFKVVFFEDLADRPSAVTSSVCAWLGLDKEPLEQATFSVENRTAQYRAKRLQQAAVAVNRRAEVFFRRHRGLKRLLRSGYYGVNKARPSDEMSDSTRARLNEFYSAHNQRLTAQLTRVGLAVPPSWS